MTNRTRLILLLTLFITVILGVTFYYGSIFDERPGIISAWRIREKSLGTLDTQLQGLAKQIQSTQGEGICKNDSQCRVVGLGAKVCNLYKDFLVYSIQDVHEERLLHFISEFNNLREKMVDMSFSVGQCGKKPASVRCVSKRCTPVLNEGEGQ